MRPRLAGAAAREERPDAETDLVSWLEHPNASVDRRDVLRRAHKARLIECDVSAKTVEISPTGLAYVEQNLLPNASA